MCFSFSTQHNTNFTLVVVVVAAAAVAVVAAAAKTVAVVVAPWMFFVLNLQLASFHTLLLQFVQFLH
tara:strand:+ start:526 stop:726 length:201 start_codon:yes stop_codon:yes gene_type:complete